MEAPDRSPTAKSSGNKATSTMTARSYDCTYCKRGFTNAQALGGHMNIHRKDRKQDKFNAQNPHTYAHFPFEIPPEVDIRPQPRFPVLNRGMQVIGQASTSPTQLPLSKKLPLFSESPSSTREADCGPDGVDLELRLGLDRPGSSVMGRDNTRNFFDY